MKARRDFSQLDEQPKFQECWRLVETAGFAWAYPMEKGQKQRFDKIFLHPKNLDET